MERIKKSRMIAYTACIFLSMWVLSSAHAALSFLNSSIFEFYGLQEFQRGLPGSVNTTLSMIAFMLVIVLIGKIRKPVIILSGALLSAAVLFVLTGSLPFTGFVTAIGALGFAGGLIDSVTSASMSDLYTGKRSAQMMCALHAVYGMAGFLMPFAYKQMMKGDARFQTAYLPLAIVSLLLGAMILLVTRGKFRDFEAEDASSMRFSLPAFKRLFTNRRIVMMIVILFALGMFFNGILDYGKSFMTARHGAYEAIIVSCLYFSIALSRLVMSFVRVNPLKFTRAALIVCFVFLAIASFVENAEASLVFMILSMTACGPIIPMVISMACEDAPSDRFLASGVLLMFHFLGKTVFAPLFGQAEASLGMDWAMMFTALSALLGAFAALLIPEKEIRK